MGKRKAKPWRSPHRKSPFRNWFQSAGENLKNMDPSMLAFGGAGVLMSAMFGGEDEDAGAQFQGNIDEHLQGFKDIDTGNLFADAQNTFAGAKNTFEGLDTKFENQFAGMENMYKQMDEIDTQNVYEDLTVNQQQAQFQAQQGAQQRANIMQNLQGAAGGSGIAGLAQAMANQGQLATQAASASIGEQESRNQMLRAQGEENIRRQQQARQEMIARGGMDIQQMERQGATTAEQMRQQNMMAIAQGGMQAQQMRMQGAMEAQRLQLQGASDARALQFQREQGLMGYYSGLQQAERENQIADKSWLEKTFSDRKLKKNIKVIGKSPSGINIYNFEYKDSKFGKGVYQGVMSDDIPKNAVIKHNNGYDMVDYSKLDVDFIKIKN
tara:strand:- start:10364 stop:11509 length:1146 start_codon:yes stop_codon:yes gene_type:complete